MLQTKAERLQQVLDNLLEKLEIPIYLKPMLNSLVTNSTQSFQQLQDSDVDELLGYVKEQIHYVEHGEPVYDGDLDELSHD